MNKKLYWAERYHKNTKGLPMTFSNALFLVPIYDAFERYQRVCVIKSVQCFPVGTRITTEQGYKNIEEIQIGDRVYTHKGRSKRVTNIFSKRYRGSLVYIKAGYNKEIRCTPEHPFYTLDLFTDRKYFVEADKLIQGQTLFIHNKGGSFPLDTKVKNKYTINFNGYVYNFSVEEDESYIANGFVVHNCGVSECSIISHLEEASRGLSILYVLPKTDLRNTFVQNRINKVIQRVDYYKNLMQQVNTKSRVDSVILKNFGLGTIKYVDSNSESNFIEYPADAIYLDEKDRMNQVNIELAPDRLDRSKYKYQRELSNPTVESFGIHASWEISTQGIWHVKCPHCNDHQPLDWFVNVVREVGDRKYEAVDKEWNAGDRQEPRVYCRKCWKPIERFSKGEYVHRYQNKLWHGYHINKIFGSPYTDLDSMIKTFYLALSNDTKLQIFFNSVLGLPYASSQSKITENALNECRIAGYFQPAGNDDGLSMIGIDVGTYFHIVIRKLDVVEGREKKRMLFCGKVRTEEEIDDLIEKYKVKGGVIDALPETRVVARLQTKYSWLYKCFLGEYKDPVMNKDNKTLNFDRTTILDEVKENVDEKKYANYANMASHDEYYTHMQASTRVYDADRNRFIWVQSTKEDHLQLAEAYLELGFKLKLSSNIFEFYNKLQKDKKPKGKSGDTQAQAMKKILDNFYGK